MLNECELSSLGEVAKIFTNEQCASTVGPASVLPCVVAQERLGEPTATLEPCPEVKRRGGVAKVEPINWCFNRRVRVPCQFADREQVES